MHQKMSTLVVIIFCLTAWSETGILKGVVLAGKTKSPVPDAIVALRQKGLLDTTNDKGVFQFSFTVNVLQNGLKNGVLQQPHYFPGRGVVFANSTTGDVKIDIFSLSGKVVATLHNSQLAAGVNTIPVNSCPAGTYLRRIQTPSRELIFQFCIYENGNHSGRLNRYDSVNNMNANQTSITAAVAGIDTIITPLL